VQVTRHEQEGHLREAVVGPERGGAASQTFPADFDNPASWLHVFPLESEVVSCASAATAKGLPLGRELKTLVLQTTAGLRVVHIRGDQQLDLRAVKSALGVREAYLASGATLKQLGLEPGIVHPFDLALWPLCHLIEQDVLDLNWVSTNAGRHDAFVVFDPVVLLRARRTLIGTYEKR